MKFNFEKQYQFYLRKVKLDERKMGEIQRKETRQAFYAGISQAVLYFITIDMPEDDAVKQLENMVKQATDYWNMFNINKN